MLKPRCIESFARKIFKLQLGPWLNRTTTPSSQQFFFFGNVSFPNHEPQHREFHKCIVSYQTEEKSPELETDDLRTQLVEALDQQSHALATTISSKLIQRLTTMSSERSLSAQDKEILVFAYLARGWIQNSIEDLSKSIELNPLLFNGYYFRARIYLTLNQMDKAFQDIETCLSLNPDCTEAYLTRAFIYEQGQDYEKAIEDYERAIHIHPPARQDPQILDRLAGLYWRVARASLDVNMDQWHTNLEKSNQLCMETIEILTNRIENHSDTNSVGSLGHGSHLGVVALEGTVTDNNTSHDAPLHSAEKCHRIRLCSNIASNYVGMNQYQQALQYYTTAIKFIREMEQENDLSTTKLFATYQAYMNRGFLLMQYFKKYDLALKDFKKAFDIADSSRADDKTPQWETQKYQIYVANSELAMVHLNMNEIDKACLYMLRAEIALLEICKSRATTTTTTDSPVNDTNESNTENKNSQQVEKVETPFPFNLFLCGKSLEQFALHIRQTYPHSEITHPVGNALYLLDIICILEGDYENALKLLNIYIDELNLQEHLEIIYANRADAKIKLGKYHEAIQDCNSSLELDPNFYAAFFNRGEAYFRLHELDKAKRDFDLALEKAPFLKQELLNLWPTFDEYQLSNTQND